MRWQIADVGGSLSGSIADSGWGLWVAIDKVYFLEQLSVGFLMGWFTQMYWGCSVPVETVLFQDFRLFLGEFGEDQVVE